MSCLLLALVFTASGWLPIAPRAMRLPGSPSMVLTTSSGVSRTRPVVLIDDDRPSQWPPARWYRAYRQRRREANLARKVEVKRLKAVHYSAQEGFCLSREESDEIRALSGRQADHYGEITPKGFSELGLRLGLDSSDSFADLGSGTGKVVLQAVSDFGCRSGVGVELARSRHEVALAGLRNAGGGVQN
eukprot:3038771-Prymnesium_polylepis.2